MFFVNAPLMHTVFLLRKQHLYLQLMVLQKARLPASAGVLDILGNVAIMSHVVAYAITNDCANARRDPLYLGEPLCPGLPYL